ncbi:MAG: hypothetical protein Q4C63_10020, partial [Eubacteriales bacterium]|nr:hypothetical protein [Eubacteriales bacterium]
AYTYTVNEKQVTVGEDAKTAVAALGKAKEEKTLNNCAAGDGTAKDKVYLYDNFDLHVSTNDKNKQIVWEIALKNANTATEEGLKIGDTAARVKQLYPKAVESYGLYTETLGNTQIIVDCGIKNDKVVAISYQYYEAKK